MIDGQLNERAWIEAPPLTGFTQAGPFEGRPASEQTDVRIISDEVAIYTNLRAEDLRHGF